MGIAGPETAKMSTDKAVDMCVWHGHMVGDRRDVRRDKTDLYTSAWLYLTVQFSSFQSLSRVRLFATPWITARQASLSITISWSSLRLTFIDSVMPSSHLILCHPLLLLPPIPPSIRVFSNESTLPHEVAKVLLVFSKMKQGAELHLRYTPWCTLRRARKTVFMDSCVCRRRQVARMMATCQMWVVV